MLDQKTHGVKAKAKKIINPVLGGDTSGTGDNCLLPVRKGGSYEYEKQKFDINNKR